MVADKVPAIKIPKLTVDQFVLEATKGKMSMDLLDDAKKIASLRHIGIKKTKLISTPESRAIGEAKIIDVESEVVEQVTNRHNNFLVNISLRSYNIGL